MPLTDAELLERLSRHVPPTAVLLGMELLAVDAAEGSTRMRFRVQPEFCNPMGNLQGGFYAAMMDDAAVTAIIAKAGRRIVVPTLEFKVSFLGAARLGSSVIVEGRCLKLGRTTAFAEADMTDEAGNRLLARLSMTGLPRDFPERPHLVAARPPDGRAG
jgi:uncharacterized protein (TIGR00369 family)